MKALSLLCAALAATAAAAAPPQETRIEITAKGISPMIVEVNVGQKVTWTNATGTDQTVTEGRAKDGGEMPLFDSGRIPAGGAFGFTFTRPGTYAYRSMLDASLTGKILVRPLP